jgi:peptidase M23-like protein
VSRRTLLCAVVGLTLAVAGCAAPVPGSGSSAPPPVAAEVLTPLLVTPLAPDPVPFRGSDGRFHVVYELMMLNAGPRDATIAGVESRADGPQGRVVGALSAPEVVARSLLVGDYTIPPRPLTVLPSGRNAIVVMDDSYDTREAVPATFVNAVRATFGPVVPAQAEFANDFPTESLALATPVRVSPAAPTAIGPPLVGPDWVAVNACCSLSPHRGAMVPLGGRINGAERYAIDWSRFDLTARPIVDLTAGTQATFRGDPTRNEDYFTFGQPVLAVADATVVTVVADRPEAPPRVQVPGLAVGELGGNRIVLDLGGGVYAFYAHLETGSPTIRPGDRVRRGQQIARTGNSGNTTESHLHFGLMDSPQPLTATNLPFEIDAFTFRGTVTPDGVLPDPPPGPRAREAPLIDSAVDFPA